MTLYQSEVSLEDHPSGFVDRFCSFSLLAFELERGAGAP